MYSELLSKTYRHQVEVLLHRVNHALQILSLLLLLTPPLEQLLRQLHHPDREDRGMMGKHSVTDRVSDWLVSAVVWLAGSHLRSLTSDLLCSSLMDLLNDMFSSFSWNTHTVSFPSLQFHITLTYINFLFNLMINIMATSAISNTDTQRHTHWQECWLMSAVLINTFKKMKCVYVLPVVSDCSSRSSSCRRWPVQQWRSHHLLHSSLLLLLLLLPAGLQVWRRTCFIQKCWGNVWCHRRLTGDLTDRC